MAEDKLNRLQDYYLQDRLDEIDPDYLHFEEKKIDESDLDRVLGLLDLDFDKALPNPHNSIILYIVGLSDEFDFDRERCDVSGGAPPDIDVDFLAAQRHDAINVLKEIWGEDRSAYIGTYNTLKPKGIVDRWYSVNEPAPMEAGLTDAQKDAWFKKKMSWNKQKTQVKSLIPDAVQGAEPTWQKALDANPELSEVNADLIHDAPVLEGLTIGAGIHAGGVVISNEPIINRCPIRIKKEKKKVDGKNVEVKKMVTEWDKDELEDPRVSLLKYDALSIKNLDIVFECFRLIKENHGEDLDLHEDMPDGEKAVYDNMMAGLLSGGFQIETSDGMADVIQKIDPTCIEHLAVVLALYRPGPLSAGMPDQYQRNRISGKPPADMHPLVAEVLSSTHYTIIYQETLMQIFEKIGGFNSDDALMAMRHCAKKKEDKMAKLKPQFVSGSISNGLTKGQATSLWDDIIGFAAYAFNKSHSIAYARLTYVTMWLKTFYPEEFFCALMTIRSTLDGSAAWQTKAGKYIQEANIFDVQVKEPSVNHSGESFNIVGNNIYFGFSGIKDVGSSASQTIEKLRGDRPFKDIDDFVVRCISKVNKGTAEALACSGAFSQLGYYGVDLGNKMGDLYKYWRDRIAYQDHLVATRERLEFREFVTPLIDERKKLRAMFKRKKYEAMDFATKSCLPEWKRLQELEVETIDFLGEERPFKKMPALRPKKEPVRPKLLRAPSRISIPDMIKQATYIGCYLTDRDLCDECFPSVPHLTFAKKHIMNGNAYGSASASVISVELKKQSNGRQSIRATLAHGETIVNAYVNKKDHTKKGDLPSPGEIVFIKYRGKTIETNDGELKVSLSINHLHVYGAEKPFCTSQYKRKNYGRRR